MQLLHFLISYDTLIFLVNTVVYVVVYILWTYNEEVYF